MCDELGEGGTRKHTSTSPLKVCRPQVERADRSPGINDCTASGISIKNTRLCFDESSILNHYLSQGITGGSVWQGVLTGLSDGRDSHVDHKDRGSISLSVEEAWFSHRYPACISVLCRCCMYIRNTQKVIQSLRPSNSVKSSHVSLPQSTQITTRLPGNVKEFRQGINSFLPESIDKTAKHQIASIGPVSNNILDAREPSSLKETSLRKVLPQHVEVDEPGMLESTRS
jgi:hypothetical protein